MTENPALIEALPRQLEQEKKHREVHICCPDSNDIGLCGARREEAWYYGVPEKQATCAVCLDLYGIEEGL